MHPNFKKGRLLVCCCFILLAQFANAADLSRASYGATHLPIWSELSYFERSVISDLHLARNNNPDALLGLYLVASGTRELAEFESVNARIHGFLKGFKEGLVDKDDERYVGEQLNDAMHAELFIKPGSKAPSGYAAHQSRLMGIFETGEFNCISSALLYTVLATHLGLNAQGVIIPSHAFVQLNTELGPIEVETTSTQGFDLHHSPEFYRQHSSYWYEVRGLTPSTYEDYLARQIVSPTILGAKNMLNQHTGTEVMSYSDGARLAEISAYIHPDYLLAQRKRLQFYNNEIHRLDINAHWDTLERLFNTTYERVINDALAVGRPEVLVEPVLYYQLNALKTHAKLAQKEQTLAVFEDIVATHPALPEQQENIETDLAGAIRTLAGLMTDKGEFENALNTVDDAQVYLPQLAQWPQITRWVYSRWAESLWREQQWQEVIYVATDWLEHPDLSATDAKALEILTLAYQNLVTTALQNGEVETALAHIELCEISNPPEVCIPARDLTKNVKL